MPVPTTPPPEDFRAAALRHYDDAQLLADQGRPDNAIYLAGYVQECCAKSYLSKVSSTFLPKKLGHDLETLGQAAQLFLAASSVRSPSHLASMVDASSVIGHAHPHRRYWPDHWTQDDAHEAMADARDALVRMVWGPVLDNGDPLP